MFKKTKSNNVPKKRSVISILQKKLNKKKTSQETKRKTIIIRIAVLIAVAIISALFVVYVLLGSEARMQKKLEIYATEMYDQGKIKGNSNSYTLNLKYLERNNYDMSIFEKNNCDKTSTYIVIGVNSKNEIMSLTPQLSCGPDKGK